MAWRPGNELSESSDDAVKLVEARAVRSYLAPQRATGPGAVSASQTRPAAPASREPVLRPRKR